MARVHVAVVVGDESDFVNTCEGEAPHMDFHAVPVGRDVDNGGAVGTLGRLVEDALAGIGLLIRFSFRG